jgi:hypothetical protein
MIEGSVEIRTSGGERIVALSDYLDAASEEAAHVNAHAWIKQLRHAKIEGRGFRQRFTIRGDSLWWFTEIYLHKEGALVDIHRTLAATRVLISREQPSQLRVISGSPVVRHVAPLLAKASNVEAAGVIAAYEWKNRLRQLQRRAAKLTLSAWASRFRYRPATEPDSPRVAAFVHRAFWRSGSEDGSAESYIGPVLQALEERVGSDGIRYVGIGPPVNFRTRQRWKTVTAGANERVVPVERYAPWDVLRDSRDLWKSRHRYFELVSHSEDLQRASVIDDIDCWPIVREQLAGVVFLQWPWSARAMDEAAAVLDALRPSSVLTYAEAGGWGRALILEARRRGIPSVGLQHGFIYHRWLNYLHEQDEMEPGGRSDSGFPAPTLTLLFDEYASRHLREHGRLRESSLKVTGSPRLDVLMDRLATVGPAEVARVRSDAAARDGDVLVLLTTKEKEARHVLPALVASVGSLDGVRLVIKPHPAETADAYERFSRSPGVSVLDPQSELAPALAASRAVVTVNSTVALDAGVAEIPALVIGLPNNLSPFVEAGALAGATVDEITAQLRRILYDEGFRQQLSAARRDILGAHAMRAGGTAAARSADAVLELTQRGRTN